MTLTLPTFRNPAAVPRAERFARWFARHGAQVALGVGMAAVAGALGFAIVLNQEKLQERAADQLSIARNRISAGKSKEALEVLDSVLAVNRVRPAALQAYVMKGELLLSENKAAEADAVYREALAQTTHPFYRALFLSGQASAAVVLQKWEEAEALLRSFLRDYPEHFLVPRATMELGRVQVVEKKWKEAQAAFERLVTLYPKSAWVPEAQAALAEIKTRRPPEKNEGSPQRM